MNDTTIQKVGFILDLFKGRMLARNMALLNLQQYT